MKKKKYISVAVILVASIFLTACLTQLAKSGENNKSANLFGQEGEEKAVSSREVVIYPIYVENNDGGTITVDREAAQEGETVTISVTATLGYQLKEIYLNEEKIEGNSFEMPGQAVVLTPSFAREETRYQITTKNSRYGRVLVEEEMSARAGDKVTVDYYALNGYVLDYITLNGKKTELDSQNAFTMPAEEVVVSAVFKKAIADTDVAITTENKASDGVSNWYFEYKPTGFLVTAKVNDATVIETGEAKYQDYVECMFNIYQEGITEWQSGKTVTYVVTAGEQTFMQTAVTSMELSKPMEVKENFKYSVTRKRLMDKDGYSGYEVQMKIPYEALGTTYEKALGNICVCPASRNSESLVTRKWKNSCDWFDISTHYRVSADGSVAK